MYALLMFFSSVSLESLVPSAGRTETLPRVLNVATCALISSDNVLIWDLVLEGDDTTKLVMAAFANPLMYEFLLTFSRVISRDVWLDGTSGDGGQSDMLRMGNF